jgi:MoaA/NifB/PqqE/SkfB family radical SAM enzyme
MKHYNILYRGPLSSCNYGCTYCPFAKRTETARELEGDRQSLSKFVDWTETIQKIEDRLTLGILFTPWGEALVRSWYRQAMIRLSHQPNILRVACQTNLSFPLKWLSEANFESLALWCTFHPTETTIDRFLAKVFELRLMGVRLSVGVVGLKEHFAEIERLRSRLPQDVYLWVNAYKRDINYYNETDVLFLRSIDKHFDTNNHRHASHGFDCFAGETTFTVDGAGTMRRCHFIDTPIGNIFDSDWQSSLIPRKCSNEHCGCHIGYVHLKRLKLNEVYGSGLLERIPQSMQN